MWIKTLITALTASFLLLLASCGTTGTPLSWNGSPSVSGGGVVYAIDQVARRNANAGTSQAYRVLVRMDNETFYEQLVQDMLPSDVHVGDHVRIENGIVVASN